MALKWYQRSAGQGNSTGQNKLGDLYYFGRGVTKDLVNTVSLYQRSADEEMKMRSLILVTCSNTDMVWKKISPGGV